MVKLWLSSHLYCSNFLFYISSRCRHLSCTFVYTIVILLNSRHVFLQSASILWNAVPFFVYVWCVAVGTDRHYRSSDHISCELKQRHYSSSDHISCELKQRHVTKKVRCTHSRSRVKMDAVVTRLRQHTSKQTQISSIIVLLFFIY